MEAFAAANPIAFSICFAAAMVPVSIFAYFFFRD